MKNIEIKGAKKNFTLSHEESSSEGEYSYPDTMMDDLELDFRPSEEEKNQPNIETEFLDSHELAKQSCQHKFDYQLDEKNQIGFYKNQKSGMHYAYFYSDKYKKIISGVKFLVHSGFPYIKIIGFYELTDSYNNPDYFVNTKKDPLNMGNYDHELAGEIKKSLTKIMNSAYKKFGSKSSHSSSGGYST